jgi:hypothetical protein
LNEAAIKNLHKIIDDWKNDKTQLPTINISSSNTPFMGRWWENIPPDSPKDYIPTSYPVTIKFIPNNEKIFTLDLTKPQPKGKCTKTTSVWGFSTISKNTEIIIVSIDSIDAMTETTTNKYKAQPNDIILAVKANDDLTFTTNGIEKILTDTSIQHIQLKIKRSYPDWEVTSHNHEVEYVNEKKAKILIATHQESSLKIITLNPEGIIAEAEINPVLPDRYKGKKEEIKYANDTTKYLGLQISSSRGKTPQHDSIMKQLYARAILASELSKNIRSFRNLANTVTSFVNYGLATTVSDTKMSSTHFEPSWPDLHSTA